MKRKLIKLLAIVLTIALSTVGCTKENKNKDSNKQLNEYNIKNSNYIHLTMLFPTTINPILNKDKSVGYIMDLIYDGLFEMDENYNVEPTLVETYTKSSDGKSINIKLKSDATWHNNKEVTSSDVSYTIDLIKNTSDSPYSNFVKNIKSINISDSKNFTIELEENDPFIIDKLTFPIVSKEQLNDLNKNQIKEYKYNLLGNGPYKIKEYEDRKYIILEKNENYFGEIAQNGKEVFVRMVPDKESQTEMVLSLDSDIASIGLRELSKFEDTEEFNVTSYEGRDYEMVIFNYDNEFLNDVNFRKAIISSIDREQLIKEAYVNNATLSNFPLNTNSRYYDKSIKGLDYDKEKAIGYLTESLKSVNESIKLQQQAEVNKENSKDLQGIIEDNSNEELSNPELSREEIKEILGELELKIVVYSGNSEREKVANTIRQSLASIGIRSVVEKLNEEDLEKVLNSKEYDLAVVGYSLSSVPDARNILEACNIKDEKLSNYINSLGNCKTEDEIKKVYSQIQNHVAENGSFISLGIIDNFIVSNKRLEGNIYPNDFDIYKGISNLKMNK